MQIVEDLAHAAAVGFDLVDARIELERRSSRPDSCTRCRSATSVTSAFSGNRVTFMSGARAYSLNAFTIAFIASTCCTMVYVARSSICASSPCHLREVAAAHALGRQLDRRERILDLVREAARDLAPGRVALRLQQRADVVEHDDVAALALGLGLGVLVAGSGVQAHTSTRAPAASGLRSSCSRHSSSPCARRAVTSATKRA